MSACEVYMKLVLSLEYGKLFAGILQSNEDEEMMALGGFMCFCLFMLLIGIVLMYAAIAKKWCFQKKKTGMGYRKAYNEFDGSGTSNSQQMQATNSENAQNGQVFELGDNYQGTLGVL